MRNYNFSVCISSVIEKEDGFYDYRYAAKAAIEAMGLEAVRNPEDIRTQNNFESELRDNSDFFVIILGKAPSEMVDRELRIALARGIPILVFVKISYDKKGHKVFPQSVKDGLYHISPDLYNMHITTFFSCEELARSLAEELRLSIYRKTKLSPLIGIDPPVAYTEGVKLIRDAKNRVVVSQHTSSLILGPRKGNTSEQVFYEELVHWILTDREQADYFIHYFSTISTIKAMKSGEYNLKSAKATMETILSKRCASDRFLIKGSDELLTVPHVIGDTGLGLNFWIGEHRYYLFLPCFLTKDSELQGIISNVQRIGHGFSSEELLALYDEGVESSNN